MKKELAMNKNKTIVLLDKTWLKLSMKWMINTKAITCLSKIEGWCPK
jgi:hypothetical protein